jgi:hypothetical protein
MLTSLHLPNERRFALDLFANDFETNDILFQSLSVSNGIMGTPK